MGNVEDSVQIFRTFYQATTPVCDWRAKQLFFEHQLQELLVVFQVSLS